MQLVNRRFLLSGILIGTLCAGSAWAQDSKSTDQKKGPAGLFSCPNSPALQLPMP